MMERGPTDGNDVPRKAIKIRKCGQMRLKVDKPKEEQKPAEEAAPVESKAPEAKPE
jgi:hypothetical protein